MKNEIISKETDYIFHYIRNLDAFNETNDRDVVYKDIDYAFLLFCAEKAQTHLTRLKKYLRDSIKTNKPINQ